MVTKRDDIDDLLPKLPEVGTASGSTTEETQEKQENTEQVDVRQDKEEMTGLVITQQPVETADNMTDKTPEVESVVVTTLVDEEFSRLLPSVEELTVSRTEENVAELRTEGDVASEQTQLTTVLDMQQPEAIAETSGLPDVLEEEQQQQQQQQQEQQQPIEIQQQQQQEEVIATLEVSESVEVVPKPVELTTTVMTELPTMPAYPCFDNLIAGEYNQ